MLTETDSYDYKPSVYNQFYLTLDKTNNQIIASGFVEKWGAFNITYDEINYNRDETIVANTIKIYRGNKTHMRLVLDKYTGDLKVLNDIDYKNEGIEKSLDAKIRGGVSMGMYGQDLVMQRIVRKRFLKKINLKGFKLTFRSKYRAKAMYKNIE